MNRSRSIAAMTLLICCLTVAQGFTSSDWKHDIEYLKTELPKRHKDLFFSVDRETFEGKLDEMTENLADKTETDIVLSLQKIIAEMGDDHTGIDYRSILMGEGVIHMSLNWFSDGLHILALPNTYESALGGRITAINDVPIDTVIDRFSGLLSKTNDALIKQRIPGMLPSIALLKHFDIIEGESGTFSIVNQDGQEKSVVMEKTDNIVGPGFRMVGVTPDSRPLCQQRPRELFWFQFLEDEGILYVQYNRCWSRELEQRYGSKERTEKLPSFEEFAAQVIEKISSDPVEKLVVDLRFNGGGSSPQGSALARKIGTLSRINKTGRLFVVIGKRTYSSAIINAIDFKKYTNAILIGEPTSGKPNHFGEVKRFTLPKSGLSVHYSSKYFRYLDDDPNSLMPDMLVETSFDDYASGKDPVLEAIRNSGVMD